MNRFVFQRGMKKLRSKLIAIVKKIALYFKIERKVEVNVVQIKYLDILKNKKVLITGGSSGIGRSIAEKCLATGADVIITGRNIERLELVSKELNNSRLNVLEWDVRDSKITDEKIKKVIEVLGGLDIVFNNAGVYTDKGFFETEGTDFEQVMESNVKGLFFIAQSTSRYFIDKKQRGKIINIGSIRGIQGASEPYGISKWGVMGLTKGLGKELAKYGIIVNGIAPGVTATAINEIDARKNAYYRQSKDNRVALAEEIAEIAVFLASDAANHIIGEVIVCDGGESLI